ncbi:Uncharacterised protein [Streptococcus pyogenes]|nr:Uncharacterised protein [Streptococcus pyogenes]
MKILDIIFNLSDRKMIFLENVEKLGGYIVPFTLIILSVAYNFRLSYLGCCTRRYIPYCDLYLFYTYCLSIFAL